MFVDVNNQPNLKRQCNGTNIGPFLEIAMGGDLTGVQEEQSLGKDDFSPAN